MKNIEPVPYIVHESEMARSERAVKRLWVLSIIIFIAFVISNSLWLVYESQWETKEETTVSQEVSTEGGGDAIVNNGGDLNYGTSKTNGQDN